MPWPVGALVLSPMPSMGASLALSAAREAGGNALPEAKPDTEQNGVRSLGCCDR